MSERDGEQGTSNDDDGKQKIKVNENAKGSSRPRGRQSSVDNHVPTAAQCKDLASV